jgi:hypothetical protein
MRHILNPVCAAPLYGKSNIALLHQPLHSPNVFIPAEAPKTQPLFDAHFRFLELRTCHRMGYVRLPADMSSLTSTLKRSRSDAAASGQAVF